MSMTSSFALPVSLIAGILVPAVPYFPTYVHAIYKRGSQSMKRIAKIVFGSGPLSLQAMSLTLMRRNVSLRRTQLSIIQCEGALQ